MMMMMMMMVVMMMMMDDDGDDDNDDNDDDDDIEDYDRRALLHHEDDVSVPRAQEEGPLVLEMLSTTHCSELWLATLHLLSLEMSETMSLHPATDRLRAKTPAPSVRWLRFVAAATSMFQRKGRHAWQGKLRV